MSRSQPAVEVAKASTLTLGQRQCPYSSLWMLVSTIDVRPVTPLRGFNSVECSLMIIADVAVVMVIEL